MKKISKKILSIFLALMMMVSILPAGAITVQAAQTSCTVDEAIAWARSKKGQSVAHRYGSAGQCIVYIAAYADAIGLPSFYVGGGNANAYCDRDGMNGYTKVWGNYQKGDIIVWNYNSCHIGIFLGYNADGSFNWIDSNWAWTGSCYEHNGNRHPDGTYWYSPANIYCGFRPNWKTVNPIPKTPSIAANCGLNVAKDTVATISWNGVSGATSYKVFVNGIQVQNNASRSYAIKLSQAKKYEVFVKASNSAGDSAASNKLTINAFNPSKVTFKDYDGTILNEQSVKYGEAAVPPSPVREGYTFTGWDKSYSNITADTVITAQYKINTYTVKFLDKDGNLLSTQKVDYGSAAIEPENKNVPTGFEFLGWDVQDYKAVKSNLTVRGIYAWGNTDLPIVLTNMRAERQDDGYYVYFDLTNYPNAITRGRAVVSLKTANGKLVDATESAAFSIPKNGTKTGMEVFIPCEKTATTAEIEIVNSYSSGVPISKSVYKSIDNGKMWSEWTTEKPDEGTYSDIEERTEYRYKTKSTTTSYATSMSGWTRTGYSLVTASSGTIDYVSSWPSGFNRNSWHYKNYNRSPKTNSETSTSVTRVSNSTVGYLYWHWCYGDEAWSNGGNRTISDCQESYWQTFHAWVSGSQLGWNGNARAYAYTNKSVCNTTYWWFSWDCNNATQIPLNRCSYTTYNKLYNYYKISDWSEWSPDEPSNPYDMEQRTVYRIMSTDIGNEDTSGNERTTSGTLDSSYAGKQATLFVYKVDEASDYSNEYVGQTTIAEDGSYSFTYKLREEPTEKTGDFTIALGIEGTTNTMVIGTIEAPKPKYTVKFLSKDGATLIDTQTVTEGESATVPEAPEVEGYTFVGWSEKTTNIKEDVEVTALYKENVYTVVFVDWVQELVAVREFTFGSVITPPETTKIEGYDFSGWDGITSDTVATQNMVVTAKYDKETYTVKFFDFDGNVISTQTVEYKDSATEPELTVDDNMTFLGWSNPANPSDYYEVTDNLELYPQYVFKETTSTPSANVESGEYTSVQTVTLSCETEDALIYYTTDGTDPSDSRIAKLYTEPITINSTCKLQYIAVSMGRNDSAVGTKYYCINNPSVKSDWMLYSELPSEVRNNISDYNLESDTGYRYKNVSTTGLVLVATRLASEGWTYMGKGYSEYSAWQDEPIEVDDRYIDFEIDTQQVTDTSKTWYRYSHYKYNDNGVVKYSPVSVSGFDCEYEEITLESRLSIAGFTDDSVSYYNYNDEQWFTQTKVNGLKTQYRSRYTINSYYKWTSWDVELPSSNESREYETDTVYRYSNPIFHIVSITGNNSDTVLMKDGTMIDTSKYDNLYGYNLDGLYLNEDFTSKYDLSTPVTESLTLYAKYIPKTYSVIFQMQDGTELDAQTVEYLTPAVAPETDSVPGYVFAGWDKEFDCITEDTVITGRYFKTSEYTMVSLDKENATLFDGSSIQLKLTIMPADLANEEVEWTSSNPSVVSVDETGLVTATGAGIATVSVKSVKTNHTAACTITVVSNENSTIVLSANSYLNYDELGYLRRIAHDSTVDEIVSQFQNTGLEFLGLNGEKLLSSDKIGTGTRINLYKDDEIIDTNTVIVTADMTGDGIISNRDVVMFNKYQVQKVTPEECQILAMDVNGDGYVNNKDAAMVARYLVGKEAI